MCRHDGPAKVGWLARIGDLDRGGGRNRHRNACDGGHVMATHSVRVVTVLVIMGAGCA